MTATAAVTSEPIDHVVEPPASEPASEFENTSVAAAVPAETVEAPIASEAYSETDTPPTTVDHSSVSIKDGAALTRDHDPGFQRFWNGSLGAVRSLSIDTIGGLAFIAPYVAMAASSGATPVNPSVSSAFVDDYPERLETADAHAKAGTEFMEQAGDQVFETIGVQTDSASHTFGRISMALLMLGNGLATSAKSLPQFQNAASQAKVVNTILKTPADELADFIVAADKGEPVIVSRFEAPTYQNVGAVAGDLDHLTDTMLLAAQQNLQNAGTQTRKIKDALDALNRIMPVDDFDRVTVAAQARTVSQAEETFGAVQLVNDTLSGSLGPVLQKAKLSRAIDSLFMPKPTGVLAMMDDGVNAKALKVQANDTLESITHQTSGIIGEYIKSGTIDPERISALQSEITATVDRLIENGMGNESLVSHLLHKHQTLLNIQSLNIEGHKLFDNFGVQDGQLIFKPHDTVKPVMQWTSKDGITADVYPLSGLSPQDIKALSLYTGIPNVSDTPSENFIIVQENTGEVATHFTMVRKTHNHVTANNGGAITIGQVTYHDIDYAIQVGAHPSIEGVTIALGLATHTNELNKVPIGVLYADRDFGKGIKLTPYYTRKGYIPEQFFLHPAPAMSPLGQHSFFTAGGGNRGIPLVRFNNDTHVDVTSTELRNFMRTGIIPEKYRPVDGFNPDNINILPPDLKISVENAIQGKLPEVTHAEQLFNYANQTIRYFKFDDTIYEVIDLTDANHSNPARVIAISDGRQVIAITPQAGDYSLTTDIENTPLNRIIGELFEGSVSVTEKPIIPSRMSTEEGDLFLDILNKSE
jgi:hypothetical protein